MNVEVAGVHLLQELELSAGRRVKDALLEGQDGVVEADEEEVVPDQHVSALEIERCLEQAHVGRLAHVVGDEGVAVASERGRLDESRSAVIGDDDISVLRPDGEPEEVVGGDQRRGVRPP